MRVFEVIINEAGVEPIPGMPGSYRVIYPPEYKMTPEGPLSKFEAEQKLKDAEIKFRNAKAQAYLDQKEQEKEAAKKAKEKPPAPAPAPEPASDTTSSDKSKKKKKDKKKDKPQESPSGLYARAKNRFKTNAKWLEEVEEKIMSRYGTPVKLLLRALGLYVAVTELWGLLQSLEDMYNEGEMDTERYEESREFALGLFQTAVITPWVAKMLSSAVLATKVARFIKNSFAFISAPATLGTSLAAALASEVFFVWFQKWLMSPAGQKWVSKYVYEFIVYFGKPSDIVLTELATAYKDLTGKETSGDYYTDAEERQKSFEKEKSERQNREPDAPKELGPVKPKRPAEPQVPVDNETWPPHIRDTYMNRIYVGGKIVTDETATLIPGIEKVQQVDVARKNAKQLNLPDPLADIPRKPGQPPLEPV